MFKIGYIAFALSLSLGLFGLLYWENYLRKIISFAMASNSLIVLFITLAYKENSSAPIHSIAKQTTIYTDPLPSVLMLTAIVVGISIQSIAISLYLASNVHKNNN
ncbi:MAG: multicomponent Na+:H+ antiporter subunit C [Candidatus Deianiraeaceae bacterium]|jgi:multicomponent Na+:H+ antiporter subunit C